MSDKQKLLPGFGDDDSKSGREAAKNPGRIPSAGDAIGRIGGVSRFEDLVNLLITYYDKTSAWRRGSGIPDDTTADPKKPR